MSYVICLKRGLLEACAWFPSGLPHTPFPYPLYLFSVIILSYESDHILSPMSPCIYYSIPCGAMVKESTFQGRRNKQCRFDPWVGKIPGVGNGNPLQYACLENPMDRGVWWASAHGMAESDATEWLNAQHSPNLGEFLGTPGTELSSQVLSSYLNCNLFTWLMSKLNLFSKSKNCRHSIMTLGLIKVN